MWRLPTGRVDSMVIDSDVTNYTLSSLFPATEYEISLSAVKESQESDMVRTSVFTGRLTGQRNTTWSVKKKRQDMLPIKLSTELGITLKQNVFMSLISLCFFSGGKLFVYILCHHSNDSFSSQFSKEL